MNTKARGRLHTHTQFLAKILLSKLFITSIALRNCWHEFLLNPGKISQNSAQIGQKSALCAPISKKIGNFVENVVNKAGLSNSSTGFVSFKGNMHHNYSVSTNTLDTLVNAFSQHKNHFGNFFDIFFNPPPNRYS